MPRRRQVAVQVPDLNPEANPPPKLAEDDFVSSLKNELQRMQKSSSAPSTEDLSKRAAINRRLLQDLWEVRNQFEEISVHLTIEPTQTLFATFVEYPQKWAFKETFDFSGVKTLELKDRTPSWIGFTLRFWYYKTPEGRNHLRAIFEWCDGESYHKYTGWMRTMSQAVLCDCPEDDVNLKEIHQILKDVVVRWFSGHLDRTPEKFIEHLKEKYPKGATYAKESYRE